MSSLQSRSVVRAARALFAAASHSLQTTGAAVLRHTLGGSAEPVRSGTPQTVLGQPQPSAPAPQSIRANCSDVCAHTTPHWTEEPRGAQMAQTFNLGQRLAAGNAATPKQPGLTYGRSSLQSEVLSTSLLRYLESRWLEVNRGLVPDCPLLLPVWCHTNLFRHWCSVKHKCFPWRARHQELLRTKQLGAVAQVLAGMSDHAAAGGFPALQRQSSLRAF